jgi:hypothetical protein
MGPEIKRCDASLSPAHQVLGAVLIAAAYLAIAFFAMRDLRASSLLAACITIVSTPIYGFMWIMSQWTPQSAEAARPLLFYIAANLILLISAVMSLLKVLSAKS